jgi:O-antigen/teichoic acid export membrane protein
LSGYNIVIATLRFVGVLLVLVTVSSTPTAFFGYQLAVALIELITLIIMSYRLRPVIPEGKRVLWSWAPLKPVLKFALTIAFTSSVWVMVTQTDKLVLSKILPLAEYGYFTLAVLVASGIMIISGPVSSAIMPRMAKLEAEGDHAGVIQIYRQSTQLVAVIAGSAAVTVSFYAEPLLFLWTGDKVMAQQSAPVLVLYAIGNGILAVSAFPYYLQYAKGNLRLHLIGNVGFVTLLVPAIIWAASRYGSIGAGYTWLAINIFNLLVWVPFVHHKLEPGLNRRWFGLDLLVIVAAMVVLGYALFSSVSLGGNNKLWQATVIFGFAAFTVLGGSSASSVLWTKLTSQKQ